MISGRSGEPTIFLGTNYADLRQDMTCELSTIEMPWCSRLSGSLLRSARSDNSLLMTRSRSFVCAIYYRSYFRSRFITFSHKLLSILTSFTSSTAMTFSMQLLRRIFSRLYLSTLTPNLAIRLNASSLLRHIPSSPDTMQALKKWRRMITSTTLEGRLISFPR